MDKSSSIIDIMDMELGMLRCAGRPIANSPRIC